MSRKAMKKTLERLQQNASSNMKRCITTFRELTKRRDTMTERERKLFDALFQTMFNTLENMLDYMRALEYAYSEFAEDFDKLEAIKLDKMKKAVENMDKPVQKKDKGKNPLSV